MLMPLLRPAADAIFDDARHFIAAILLRCRHVIADYFRCRDFRHYAAAADADADTAAPFRCLLRCMLSFAPLMPRHFHTLLMLMLCALMRHIYDADAAAF